MQATPRPSLVPPAPLAPDLARLWMLRPGISFLNHGSFGALPRAVAEAQNQWRQRIEAEPVEILGRRCAELVEQAKAPVGQWLGMSTADFGFVTNATEGINAVIRSFPLSAGDELLTTDHVYHAVRQTMRLAARRAGATLREIPVALPVASAEQIAATVLSALSPRTRLLVIDHVTSPTAMIFPVERITAACRERGVAVLVDGAHVPGMLPLNVAAIGAAYYAGNLHKWTCAPKGSAILWVDPGRQAQVHPTTVSHYLDEGFAREFGWQGTRDLGAWLAVPAALRFMQEFGWAQIQAHNHQMARWAHEMLTRRFSVEPITPLDGSLLGSMAAVRLPPRLAVLRGEPLAALQQRLYTEFQIEVPLMRWNEQTLLRVSCQLYNSPAEYEHLADVICAVASE